MSNTDKPTGIAAAMDIAATQLGILTRPQLAAAGVTRGTLRAQLRAGTLRRLHANVFAAGPVQPQGARELAACLACGPQAWLACESAAVHWGLPTPTSPASVQVFVRKGRARPPGVLVRQIRTLRYDETTTFTGVPITTAARTVLDLAGVLRPRALEQVLAEALVQRLATLAELGRLLRRHPLQKGCAQLRRLLDAGEPAYTRSEAEERLLALVRSARLPEPRTNVVVAGGEVDFYWAKAGVVVEVDGFRYHSTGRAFERDRRRAAQLTLAGVRVLRVTWRRLADEPNAVLVEIAQALTARP